MNAHYCKGVQHTGQKSYQKKLAENAAKRKKGLIQGVIATPEAENVVKFLDKEERRMPKTKKAKESFQYLVRPELQSVEVEECSRAYMKDPFDFGADPDNLNMYRLAKENKWSNMHGM